MILLCCCTIARLKNCVGKPHIAHAALQETAVVAVVSHIRWYQQNSVFTTREGLCSNCIVNFYIIIARIIIILEKTVAIPIVFFRYYTSCFSIDKLNNNELTIIIVPVLGGIWIVIMLSSALLEMEGYEAVGREIVVEDMHTRKKMMFDRVCKICINVSGTCRCVWLSISFEHVMLYKLYSYSLWSFWN